MLICPAYAGMILIRLIAARKALNLSRVCGDDPSCLPHIQSVLKFVPRMRG